MTTYRAAAADKAAEWHEQGMGGLVAAVRAAPDADVDFYPGWSLRDLAVHVVHVHRMACAALCEGDSRRPQFEVEVHRGTPVGALSAALADAPRLLMAALEECRHPTVWTPGGDRSASFWLRRMMAEAALHRWDAESALARAWVPRLPLAHELIDEFLTSRLSDPNLVGAGRAAVRIVSADVEWTVPTNCADDLAVLAPAQDIWLWLNRRPVAQHRVRLVGTRPAVACVTAMLDGLRRATGR